jgi:hypothetical protein
MGVVGKDIVLQSEEGVRRRGKCGKGEVDMIPLRCFRHVLRSVLYRSCYTLGVTGIVGYCLRSSDPGIFQCKT